MTGPGRPGSRSWRDQERRRLLDFAERSRLPGGGFGWLDGKGAVLPDRPVHLWINARMTHVFSLAAAAGDPRAADHAAHGMRALAGMFADTTNGGWFRAVGHDATPVDPTKTAYDHAFVLLAASTGVASGIPGADELMDQAQAVVLKRFWDEDASRCVERYDADWTGLEPYRGANSNMHAVEAFLSTGDVSGDHSWRDRALAIAGALIDGAARRHGWRVPEHFDSEWNADLEYNHDNAPDQFRPFGVTIGHSLEWARLLLALDASSNAPPAWLTEAAVGLFDHAVQTGWPEGDSVGPVYTADWNDEPVVKARLHWVMAEAVMAADALHRSTTHPHAERLYWQWWADISAEFVDTVDGSWHHELDQDGRPAHTVWTGKPDIYHAYHATMLPDLPVGTATQLPWHSTRSTGDDRSD